MATNRTRRKRGLTSTESNHEADPPAGKQSPVIPYSVTNSEQHCLEIEEHQRQQERPRCPRRSNSEYDAQNEPGPYEQRQRLIKLR